MFGRVPDQYSSTLLYCHNIGVAAGIPGLKALDLQLNVVGTNVCTRWHRDYNIGRAIITYNGG